MITSHIFLLFHLTRYVTQILVDIDEMNLYRDTIVVNGTLYKEDSIPRNKFIIYNWTYLSLPYAEVDIQKEGMYEFLYHI